MVTPRRHRVLAGLGLGLALLALTGCARAAGGAFQATLTQALPVGEDTVGQTFRPGAERLAGIDVLTATFGETPDADGELVLSLVDRAAGGEVVATTSVDGRAVADNGWVSLRFDEPAPVPHEPAFTVAWTGDSPVGLWANVPPSGVAGESRLLNDPYGGGQLLRAGRAATGDLAFRMVGAVGPLEPLAAVGRIGVGAARSLAGAPAFGVTWAVAVAGALALAVTGFRRARRRG